jgi:hypothetical protein
MNLLNNHSQSVEETIDDYLTPPDIHEARQQTLSGLPLVFIFGILLTIGHCFNAYLLLWVKTPLVLNTMVHLLLVIVGTVLVFILRKAELDTRFALLLTITSAVMGPVGSLGSLFASFICLLMMKSRSEFEEWYQTIFPRGIHSLPEEMVENLELGRDENPNNYSVIPFMDVMTIGNAQQKRDALSRMLSSFNPRFAPAFRKALQDEDGSIRVQAATAISRIENKFHSRVLSIEELHREYPENPMITQALAEHYDGYAFTGLLDSQRESSNREKAEKLYRECLVLNPDILDIRLKLGRLLIRNNKIKEAADWFKECLDGGYVTDSMKIWYMECLYRLGNFEKLRNAAITFRIAVEKYKDEQPEIINSINLWSQAGASVKGEGTA